MSCHPDLQKIATLAIQLCDFTITEGYRGKESQEKDFVEGRSKLQYPESKHNATAADGSPCSKAFDFAPYPVDYSATGRFYYVSGIMLGIASALGIKVRTGADFNRDGNVANESFKDLPHIELDY